ncbi:peptide chain release factor N(5)-glutamine methyltransferase [Rariglobus hedericola]|uniref:Release factor glutamine methyltransferase n=1 Tax=Rariglobus hedericola TaxID=2597822 RepID=A0A556QPE7_9BACT|nr:peptide chain release factor N(5)-glutamine methyltransferase [Rariglobus hedericola]TSJ78472.1 peptide chain release factor N(5)-glutamine methyltransferase [Rariglobus hedericola]
MAAPLTLLEIIQKTTDFLTTKGVESARLNAELLVGHALGLKRMQLYLQFERVLAEAELEKIRPLVKRRSLREPLQYIIGETEWSGLKLKVDRRALIPRPETEMLIELVTSRCAGTAMRILDLGTGSGAIALALAKHYADAAVTAVDYSEEALALAAENGRLLELSDRVQFIRSSWYEALTPAESYDLIVSNPPYLTAEETSAAEPEVRVHEPVSALTAADQGMADLRTIIAGAGQFLSPGGLLALETGIAQHAELLGLLAEAGFVETESRRDLTDRDRFIFARKPAA